MRKKKQKFDSGIGSNTNISYESYLKAGLENLSPKLSCRVYKLAPKAEYPMFERGKDMRVCVFWDKEKKYEFIVDTGFFYQSNRNKEDREWMRSHANVHLSIFKNSLVKKTKVKRKKKMKVGSTQDAFDGMKSK